jgi:hypothetical protein
MLRNCGYSTDVKDSCGSTPLMDALRSGHTSDARLLLDIQNVWCVYLRGVRVMVFRSTFNNILVISWRSVLLVEETTNLLQVPDKPYHIMLHRAHPTWAEFELTTLVVIGTDCIGSWKSNYHTITTTTNHYCNNTNHSQGKPITLADRKDNFWTYICTTVKLYLQYQYI